MLSGSLLANNAETLRRMAIAGVGIARVAEYHLREARSTRGELVELLADQGHRRDLDEIHMRCIAAPSCCRPG